MSRNAFLSWLAGAVIALAATGAAAEPGSRSELRLMLYGWIAGFDGKPQVLFHQGKQIFNPIEVKYTVPEGTSTKDFTVPDSAAENLRIEPTAEPPKK